MEVSLIVAMDEAKLIGASGALPWHLPEDSKAFKRITTGHPCIMGRKTWASLRRPLPGRLNIVVTRSQDYQAPGAEIVGSLEEALFLCEQKQSVWGQEVFVIGGAQLYELALPIAKRIYLTKVKDRFIGDVYFPDFDSSLYQEIKLGEGEGPPAYEMWRLDRN